MQSSFDARARFVLLWIAAEAWFPVLVAVATPSILAGGKGVGMLQIAGLVSWPIALLSQWPLLRGRVERAWLWPLAGIAAAVLYLIVFQTMWGTLSRGLLPSPNGGLSGWMLYFIASGALVGLALALPQSLAISHWRLGAPGWIIVVVGASVAGALVGGVLWHAGGGSAAGEGGPAAWAGIAGALVRHAVFAGIVGFYLWHRLEQRSVDAARERP